VMGVVDLSQRRELAASSYSPEDPLRIYMKTRQQLIAAKARMDRLAAQLNLVDIVLSGQAQQNGTPAPSLWKRLRTTKTRGGRELCEADEQGRPRNGIFVGIREPDWPSFESAWETLNDWRRALSDAEEAWSRLTDQDRAAVAGPLSV
jgi:hypothetical protein